MTTNRNAAEMSLLVDTSVWSLALRRDAPPDIPEVHELTRALKAKDGIFATGMVLQELLQGMKAAKAHDQIIQHFKNFPVLSPSIADHIEAAFLRNRCRRRGVQLGTIDALLAQLCIRHELQLLTTDRDFVHAARIIPLSIWRPGSLESS